MDGLFFRLLVVLCCALWILIGVTDPWFLRQFEALADDVVLRKDFADVNRLADPSSIDPRSRLASACVNAVVLVCQFSPLRRRLTSSQKQRDASPWSLLLVKLVYLIQHLIFQGFPDTLSASIHTSSLTFCLRNGPRSS